jgi:hypothetical protein
MELRADLQPFITGQKVSVCLTPYQARTANFGRPDPPADEIWDYIVRREAGF